MSTKEAFFSVCEDAQPAESHYLSLYVSVPYYGGPEEGGWWGSDTLLVAYKHFDTSEALEAAQAAVEALAVELNEQAKREFGEQCLREMEWLDARGLDADYLPEVDGESSYYVVTEDVPGSRVSQGCRHYE
jgi:hypothetical protein